MHNPTQTGWLESADDHERLKERERELSIHLFSLRLALCEIDYGLFRRKSGCSFSPFIKKKAGESD